MEESGEFNMKILIIDDSKTARMFSRKCVEMALPGEKLEFTEAENGAIAYDLLKKEKVDIILSDINMPVMSGFTFLRNVKMEEDLTHIPIIFITSLANDARTVNLKELGAYAVISKPIKPKEVGNVLKEIIGNKGPAAPADQDGGWGA